VFGIVFFARLKHDEWPIKTGRELTYIMPMLVTYGVGIDLAVTAAMSLSTYRIERPDAGAASAAVNIMQQIGGAVGVALLNTLSTTSTKNYLASGDPYDSMVAREAALYGYATAYWWAAGIFLIGSVLSGALYRRAAKDPPPASFNCG